jgi:hypothetical protein
MYNVKPFESSYVANRPLEGIHRAVDCFRPLEKKQTKYLKVKAIWDINEL